VQTPMPASARNQSTTEGLLFNTDNCVVRENSAIAPHIRGAR